MYRCNYHYNVLDTCLEHSINKVSKTIDRHSENKSKYRHNAIVNKGHVITNGDACCLEAKGKEVHTSINGHRTFIYHAN